MSKLDLRQKFALLMLLLISFCLLLLGARDILDTRRLSQGIETEGELLSVKLHRGGRSGKSYLVSFSFEMDGKPVLGKDTLSESAGNELRVGQTVPVIYERKLPSTAVLGDRNGLWRHRGNLPLVWALPLGLLGILGILGFGIKDFRSR